ncbi:hypothetical protein [Streptomyces sp. KLOTTS4A1]|uniref:hypothetical protein n=1 Tax=Streptomyces sp. KLOTTS4A1 TaxID=3390996 RepID=UPI0039F5346A
MTTRDQLREMIEQLSDDDIELAAERIRPLILPEPPRRTRPAFIGMGRSGHSDTSQRVDEILRETGFGE